MNYKKIKKLFIERGYDVIVKNFSDIDFCLDEYKDSFILYQSSEDPNLEYKSFIEDIVLGLKLKGAILIPEFELFRAHHNKVFMEILRDISNLNEIKNLKTEKFGTLEEFKKFSKIKEVIKVSSGSKSSNVFKYENIKKLKKNIHTFSLFNIKMRIRSFLDRKPFTPISNYRKKFITQTFIEGLRGDYKVLIYGDKYYVLFRKNRKKDFRASGSGVLFFIDKPDYGLLNYAEIVKNYFNNPIMSLDIAFDGLRYYLIEMQFIMFGNYALEKSNFFFKKEDNDWIKVNKKSDLEKEFVNVIDKYIKNI